MRSGQVFVRGEYWNAWSDEPIKQGERVKVESVEGLKLKVKKACISQPYKYALKQLSDE